MKYLVYLGVAVLVLWAAWYLLRRFRRWRRGEGDCGCDCGDCPNTGCGRREDSPDRKT